MSVVTARPARTPVRGVGDRRSPIIGAVMVAVGALTLATAIYGIAVWTSSGQLVDQYVLDAVRRASAVARVPYPVTVAVVTDPRLWCAVAVGVVVGAMLPAIQGRTRATRAAMSTAVLLAFPLLIVGLVRILRDVVLPRPHLHDWIAETSNSAPSGHAAATTACVVVLAAAAPTWLRPMVLALGGTWASVIAFGLVADGWHRPSDIVIAVLIVVGLGALLPDPHADAPPPRGAGLFRVGAWVFTVVCSAILVGASYPDTRQVVTSVGIAVVIGFALAVYRPHAYRRR